MTAMRQNHAKIQLHNFSGSAKYQESGLGEGNYFPFVNFACIK